MSFLPLLRLRFQPSRPILSSARILYKKIPNSTTTSLAVQGNAQSRTEEQYKALEKWSKTYAPVRPLQPDREAWVTDLRGNNIGITMLPGSVFSEPPRLYVVQQVLKWQLANRRKGNAWTKTKAEVRGTNRKPFPQKGRGAARHGSLRNPQFRGGGVAHGPRGTNWHYTLSRKVRALGYRIVLSVKMAQGNLSIIDKIPDCEGKTGMFHFHLTQRGCGPKRSILLVGKTVTSLAERGLFTLPYCKLLALEDLNMHDILKYKEIAIERDAIELLANYLSNDGKRIRTFLNDKT